MMTIKFKLASCIILIILAIGTHCDAKTTNETEFNYLDPWYAENHFCPKLEIANGKYSPVICSTGCGISKMFRKLNRVKFACCPGYEESTLFPDRCMEHQRNDRPLLQYLTDTGKKFTVRAILKNSNLDDFKEGRKRSAKVYTFFLPHDDNMKDADIDYSNEVNMTQQLMVQGRWYSKNFANGNRLRTLYGSQLIISTYTNGLAFVNCRAMMSVDDEILDGVVHYIDKPFGRVTKTIYQRLVTTHATKYFAKSLPQDMVELLNSTVSSEIYTVYAPDNSAWVTLTSNLKDEARLKQVIQNHIFNKLICGMTITGSDEAIGPTMFGNYLKLNIMNDAGGYLMSACGHKANLVKKDLMSENGVVHIVDRALVPIEAMQRDQALECLGSGNYHGLAEGASMMYNCRIDVGDAKRIYLVPTDKAFKWLDDNTGPFRYREKFLTSFKYRCRVMRGLIVKNENQGNSFEGNNLVQKKAYETELVGARVITTFVKERSGSRIYFNYAESATRLPIKFNGGVIYPINQILFPPDAKLEEALDLFNDSTITSERFRESKTIYGIEKITSLESYKDWTKLEESAKDYEEQVLRVSPGVIFLSAYDMGWSTRKFEANYTLNEMRNFFLLHTLQGINFGGSIDNIMRGSVLETTTMLRKKDGTFQKLLIQREKSGNTFIGYDRLPRANWSMVLDWLNPVSEGYIWKIDWPLTCIDMCTV